MLVLANSNGYYAAVNCPSQQQATDKLTVTRHSTSPANDPDTKEIAGVDPRLDVMFAPV